MLIVSFRCLVVDLHYVMKNGKLGHVSLDSLFKKSGEVQKMEQMLMLLIDLTFKFKVLKLKIM
jgi:hypothetical protein